MSAGESPWAGLSYVKGLNTCWIVCAIAAVIIIVIIALVWWRNSSSFKARYLPDPGVPEAVLISEKTRSVHARQFPPGKARSGYSSVRRPSDDAQEMLKSGLL